MNAFSNITPVHTRHIHDFKTMKVSKFQTLDLSSRGTKTGNSKFEVSSALLRKNATFGKMRLSGSNHYVYGFLPDFGYMHFKARLS